MCKASFTRTFNATTPSTVQKWVQCSPMMLFTHNINKIKGAAHKTVTLTVHVNEALPIGTCLETSPLICGCFWSFYLSQTIRYEVFILTFSIEKQAVHICRTHNACVIQLKKYTLTCNCIWIKVCLQVTFFSPVSVIKCVLFVVIRIMERKWVRHLFCPLFTPSPLAQC